MNNNQYSDNDLSTKNNKTLLEWEDVNIDSVEKYLTDDILNLLDFSSSLATDDILFHTDNIEETNIDNAFSNYTCKNFGIANNNTDSNPVSGNSNTINDIFLYPYYITSSIEIDSFNEEHALISAKPNKINIEVSNSNINDDNDAKINPLARFFIDNSTFLSLQNANINNFRKYFFVKDNTIENKSNNFYISNNIIDNNEMDIFYVDNLFSKLQTYIQKSNKTVVSKGELFDANNSNDIEVYELFLEIFSIAKKFSNNNLWQHYFIEPHYLSNLTISQYCILLDYYNSIVFDNISEIADNIFLIIVPKLLQKTINEKIKFELLLPLITRLVSFSSFDLTKLSEYLNNNNFPSFGSNGYLLERAIFNSFSQKWNP